MYNVPEKDADIHQDDYCTDTERAVCEGDAEAEDVHQEEQDGEDTVIEANLADLVRDKKQGHAEEDEDEDDTILEYCSDGDDNVNGVDDVAEDDDDGL
jgi:hypothetical protein